MPIHLRDRCVDKGRRSGVAGGVDVGAELTAREVAYARFIDARKRRLGRPFPAWSEVLAWTEEFLAGEESDDGGRQVGPRPHL